jgi:hypothetical protein
MDPAAQLQPYLRGVEQLLWAGRPDPQVWFTSMDLFLVPFSILWAAFAIYWEVGVIISPGGAFFIIPGIPPVALGLYLTFGRFVYKQYRKRRTVYGITSQRVIVLVAPRVFADAPLPYEPLTIRRSRDTRHASLVIYRPPVTWFVNRTPPCWIDANTGFLSRSPREFAFYDVADPQAMLGALDQARGYFAA